MTEVILVEYVFPVAFRTVPRPDLEGLPPLALHATGREASRTSVSCQKHTFSGLDGTHSK